MRLEGLTGTLFHLLTAGGDTVYASGFSDGRFLLVRNGMTDAQVIALLGEPLERYRPQVGDDPSWDLGMRWSRSATDSHYSVRVVLFKKGRVADVRSEFYVD